MRFVVDTSAIVALIASEPDATALHERLLAGGGLIAAATLVEVARVAMHRLGEAGVAEVRALIDEYEITIVEMGAGDSRLLSSTSATCSATRWRKRGTCRSSSTATTSPGPM